MKYIAEIKDKSVENEPFHRYFFEEMKKRDANIFPEAIKEFLPEIFLDTYEQLTDDEKNLKRHQKLIYKGIDVPVDWWIAELFVDT